MRSTIIFIMVAVIGSVVCGEVVINEVIYDPEGPDTGWEWVEFYNNSENFIQLEGWQLQKAGSEFQTVFIFPNYRIAPHSFLLLGEANIDEADLTNSLALQNGGSCTDGVRLLSASGDYTDTILYDSPNSNQLPSDINEIGQQFCPDVNSGNSIARIEDGVDTDIFADDFFECEEPTPGAENVYPIDLCIELNELILYNEQQVELIYNVENLSTKPVDNSEAEVDILCNSLPLTNIILPEIEAGETYIFSFHTDNLARGYYHFLAQLIYLQDSNLENNLAAGSIVIDSSPIIINEIMFDPPEDEPEWIELFVRNDCEYNVDNLLITDAAGGDIEFMANIEDYLVICEDESYLLQCYPHINEDKIIQASSWTALNNLQESLVLHDECGTLLDSLFYDGSSLPSGLSLERVDPYSDADVQWHPCEDELGCTPTLANSVLPFTKDLQLNTLSLTMQNNQLKHRIFIENAGLENIDQADLQCFCARNAQEFNLEWENQIEIGDSLDYQFYTDLPEENGYYVYKYFLDAEEDAFLTNNSDYNFYNKDALPIVVNEIMFDPLEEEPEWIEIKQNYFINEIDSLKMKCNEDSFWVVKPENEYFIITSGEEEAEYLNLITPYELGIMTGLPNLANTGEVIKFYDQKDNLLDSLDFNPNWTYGHKGVSTERVNPLLPAQAMNWGPCVNDDGHTLGRKNSIFTQNITSKTKLQVKPNPFSPFQGERTIISFELSEKISRVTIRVFDLKGRLVKVIKNQSLVASKGEIIWDGRDKNNKVLPVGLYIILFEATGIESEKVYSKTKTITIGR